MASNGSMWPRRTWRSSNGIATRRNAVPGAEPFFTQINLYLARANNPMCSDATKAFDEFFFSRARDVYPRYDFARMNDNEFGATLALNSTPEARGRC